MHKNLDKITDKIKKLLAMANDVSSPNEAMIAANQARKLMDKYQIDESSFNENTVNDIGEKKWFRSLNKCPIWINALAYSVGKFNDSHTILKSDVSGRFIVFQGFKTDVVLSVHMLDYLVITIERLAKAPILKGVAAKNAFKLGAADSIVQRINQIILERKNEVKTQTGTSLVICKNDYLSKHIENFGSYKEKNVSYKNKSAYQSGRKHGQKINLSNQIK